MTKHSGVNGKTVDGAARAEAAVIRQAERDGRSAEEQLALLDDRPGQSLCERARLTVE